MRGSLVYRFDLFTSEMMTKITVPSFQCDWKVMLLAFYEPYKYLQIIGIFFLLKKYSANQPDHSHSSFLNCSVCTLSVVSIILS